VRSAVAKAPGVAEVASVGGFVRQYNVFVDTVKLRSFGISLARDSLEDGHLLRAVHFHDFEDSTSRVGGIGGTTGCSSSVADISAARLFRYDSRTCV